MSKLNLRKTVVFLCALCALGAIASPAQTFKSLVNFNGTDGEYPDYGSLVQGLDGNFYGTTTLGGAHNGWGTIFKVTAGGKLTTLYSFCAEDNCLDGSYPLAGLVLANDGNFYGTTEQGALDDVGTIFKITPAGKLTTLHSFCAERGCADGGRPVAGLIQGTNGDLYGTTPDGGDHADGGGPGGTVFVITPGGTLTTLYSFCAEKNCVDGSQPYAGLVQAANGNLYGTTEYGGASTACGSLGCGTVFEITPAGKLTTLHSFNGSDGEQPMAGLVQATNGNFYGTTEYGAEGVNHGTLFEITPAGKLTTLLIFNPNTNGSDPRAPLIQATDGYLYGTTSGGGPEPNAQGTVFRITLAGKLTTLHNFFEPTGYVPYAGLLQATNGTFYGTTWRGGTYGYGTVFSLSVGLGPFVKTLPTSGAVGTSVTILGNNFSGTSSVTFNGIAAAFKVVSSTEITATVPKGATTGQVKVKTPSHTLSSNVKFRVP